MTNISLDYLLQEGATLFLCSLTEHILGENDLISSWWGRKANGIGDMSKHSGFYCQLHYSEPENPSRIV